MPHAQPVTATKFVVAATMACGHRVLARGPIDLGPAEPQLLQFGRSVTNRAAMFEPLADTGQHADLSEGGEGSHGGPFVQITMPISLETGAFTKLASSCMILSMLSYQRSFCGALVRCLWTSFAKCWNGM
jgi:hypothetical protein